MMTSLMSIFDPSMDLLSNSGWMVAIICILPMKFLFWKTPSLVLVCLNSLSSSLINLFMNQKVLFVALFLFLMNINLAGLLPLVFSPSSHLSFNISLSLVMWLGMMMFYSINNLTSLLAHMTPLGSPLVLAPALVIIELVSSIIRPVTLALRLMANIMAGHMILTLISKGVFSMLVIYKLPLFMVLSGFMMFEFGVAMIQAYVFASLMSLYWEESSH